MGYTEYMIDNLPWGGFDDIDEDFQTFIEMLNNESFFRSFGNGILNFMQTRIPSLTSETAIKYIEKCCTDTNVPVKDIASANTLKNWFKGGPRPKKGEDSRRSMFSLAFALQLTPEETADLFHKVYLDRAFDYRNETEIIYYFCLQNKKPWAAANDLIERSHGLCGSANDHTIYTSQIKTDIDALIDEEALLSYIANHGNNFRKKSISAKEIKNRLIDETLTVVEMETGLISSRKHAEAIGQKKEEMYRADPTLNRYSNTNARSLNHIYEVIVDRSVHEGRGTKTIFKNVRLPKEISSRFPEAGTLSKKDPTYEELRKLIILLASYNLWCQAQENNEPIDYETYIDELNNFLDEGGLPVMYPGNPFDWLFLYCSLAERPLDTFRGILAEVLENE